MVEPKDRDRQNGTSLNQFAATHGYMPATVTDHERHDNGVTLVTLDPDEDTNIEVYHDERAAHRSGENPEWAE
jgi:hypothetical protein